MVIITLDSMIKEACEFELYEKLWFSLDTHANIDLMLDNKRSPAYSITEFNKQLSRLL